MAKSEKQVAQKRWWEMVEVGRFVDELRAAGIGLLIGVPDSLLKSLCAYVTDTCGENRREKIGLVLSSVLSSVASITAFSDRQMRVNQ